MGDNAKKFLVERIDSAFLQKNHASSLFLAVDWIVTEEDSEKKLVSQTHDNGDIQLLLVEKTLTNGNRTTNKRKCTALEYNNLIILSIAHLEKRRYEFNFNQNGVTFTLKYDEFKGRKLKMLEVDAVDETERNGFSFETFPYNLTEVTDDMRYYGYRVAGMV